MGLVCFQTISRLCQQLSSQLLIQRLLHGSRTYAGVSCLKYTIYDSHVLRSRCSCYQNRWAHVDKKELAYFSPYKRIPKRYVEEIDNVVELYHDTIVHFASIFKCDVSLIEDMVRRDTRIVTSFKVKDVSERMRLVIRYGYSIHDVLSYTGIFYKSMAELAQRLEEMAKIRKISSLLRPANLSRWRYRIYMDQMLKEASLIEGHPSRDSYVAALLGCSEPELKALAEKGNHHLLTKKPSQLTTLVELLVSYGFSLEEIRQNPGVLMASIHLASKRLRRMSDLGLLLKAHMVFILTSSDENIESVIPLWMEEKEALGPHSDRKQYLMHRMALDEHQYEVLVRKAKEIKVMNARRLKHVLDVLMDHMGLRSEDIQMHPTLLYYSTERLSQRWKILQEAGVLSKTILIKELKLSEADFTDKYGDDA
ncbi:uncharacterized protein LOC121377074 [Gigantopelta aegis]|uniref:uncharacterized protein LOC121377074 n=1 Tax=Gigantopelta aegis TaxID=1735272 RepID=UPI001B887572|nr:uncharacterized protein LOC121377074 [Gigantopelta aegis]